jgi:hypothetical protein
MGRQSAGEYDRQQSNQRVSHIPILRRRCGDNAQGNMRVPPGRFSS